MMKWVAKSELPLHVCGESVGLPGLHRGALRSADISLFRTLKQLQQCSRKDPRLLEYRST